MRKKHIAIGIVVALLVGTMGIGAVKYYNHKAEQKRLSKEAYLTEYKLSTYEMDVMLNGFYVETSVDLDRTDWINNLDKSKWPDYSYINLKATQNTEKVVTVLNYDLFFIKEPYSEELVEKAKEYGFTKKKKLTVDWVMKHPKEAVEIMMSSHIANSLYVRELGQINERYKKIMKTGKD